MKVQTSNVLCYLRLLVLTGFISGYGAAVFSAQAGNAATKATIGVMSHTDFVPDRAQPQRGRLIGLPDVLAERIIEHLSNSKRFTLVDRTALRRVVLEQRFGQGIQKTYLDRTLDKAIDAMENIHGGYAVVAPDPVSPVGRARVGGGTVGTTGTLSDYNDLIKDFQDLGTTLGADYLVLGNLEKLDRSTSETAVPYSTTGRSVRKNLVDARLRLRVIDVKSGTVAGATSIRTKLSETLFEGKSSDTDQFTFYDHLGRLAAAKVLDVTFPARIVSLDPMLISRGSNDGVEKGDLYLIEYIDPFRFISNPSSGRMCYAVAAAAPVPLTRTEGAAPKPAQLPRVALGLVKSGSTARTGLDAQQHSPVFTDTIVSRLTQTRRFQMIDRQEVDQLLTEQQAQALTENRDMPSAMGTLKGADYLVYGSLASFSIEERVERLPNSSRSFRRTIGRVEGNMRVVDARSGDVLESRKISVDQPVDPAATETRKITLLADAYAEQVVLMLMNSIYPIKVAHVSADGSVYINRGNDGGLYLGEVLTVYRPGQAIIDPDTGVQLGVEETLAGEVTVTEVEDARSKGRLAEGGAISRGDLLKRTLKNKGRRASAAVREQASAPSRSGGMLAKRDAPGKPQQKATIAVGLLKVTPGAYTSRLTPGAVKQLTDELILKLHNSNRFVVMERQEVDQILDEKAFEAIASGGDIQDRLRELVGADYLIHGEIINYYIKTEQKKIPYTDEIQITAIGMAEGILRIVDVHTGAMNAGSKVLIREKYGRANDSNLVFNDMRDRFTTEAVGLIVARLYPIKILGMTADGTLYLNQGEDAGLKQGARFGVMRPGQELIDPDTGRSFGSAETKVAEVEITDVETNRSRARLISGREARRGDILRKSQAVERKPPEPEVLQPAW